MSSQAQNPNEKIKILAFGLEKRKACKTIPNLLLVVA
jgi:hypothetical protein